VRSPTPRNLAGGAFWGNRITRLIRQYLCALVMLQSRWWDFPVTCEMANVLNSDRSSIEYMQTKLLSVCCLPLILDRHRQFDPFKWAADPQRRSDFFDPRTTQFRTETFIQGFAGSAGCVEGIVRRIDCAEDGHQIQPGEILVTITTNVGWTPLFPRLAAIVTDVGAPLSHAAIVARELGIPAVVGCGNATSLLKTGDRVRVDGGKGVVEILQTAPLKP
jgi:pyruvate,water dikinase